MATPGHAPTILMLWSTPRSRSTAFFRMMCERGDYQVLHEPFSYLAEFGATEVGEMTVRSEADLLTALRGLAAGKPLFVKDTTDERYPGVLGDPQFLADEACHSFLIRHPVETIASYYAINPEVKLHQIGFETQLELFRAVREATGRKPIVIDAKDLVTHPGEVVKAYCARAGIPFLPAALHWRPVSRKEWAPSERWHREVSKSSGFQSGPSSSTATALEVADHAVLGSYLRHHLPFYEEMLAERLEV